MKQIVRYRFLNIPNKLYAEVRITIDDLNFKRTESHGSFDAGVSCNLALSPIVNLQMIKPSEMDENGSYRRAPFNPNDSIGLTKFSIPIFLRELQAIEADMKTDDLYSYVGDRLELNDKIADKVRRVFPIGKTLIELSPVIITQNDGVNENRLEGIKMKFNNEESSTLLTINDLYSFIQQFKSANIDMLAFTMYQNYIDKPKSQYVAPASTIDIIPKDSFN